MRGFGRSRRLLALGSVVLVGASAIAGLAAGGSSGAATPTVLDHFECYAAAATITPAAPKPFAHTPPKVRLKNKLNPGGFTVVPGAPNLQCKSSCPTVTIDGNSVTTAVKHATRISSAARSPSKVSNSHRRSV